MEKKIYLLHDVCGPYRYVRFVSRNGTNAGATCEKNFRKVTGLVIPKGEKVKAVIKPIKNGFTVKLKDW